MSGVTEPIILVGLDDWTAFETFESIKKTIASSVPGFAFSSNPTKNAATLNEVGASLLTSTGFAFAKDGVRDKKPKLNFAV